MAEANPIGVRRAATLAALLVAAVAVSACEPRDRRPGFWISGEVVSEPVTDWSFTDGVNEIFVETRTWYGVPHSVTTVCVAHDGNLYVPSVYSRGDPFPDSRFWNRNVARDPRVRLKIDGRIYELEATPVEDPDEWQGVFAAFARKAPYWRDLAAMPESERPDLHFMRMTPRSGDG